MGSTWLLLTALLWGTGQVSGEPDGAPPPVVPNPASPASSPPSIPPPFAPLPGRLTPVVPPPVVPSLGGPAGRSASVGEEVDLNQRTRLELIRIAVPNELIPQFFPTDEAVTAIDWEEFENLARNLEKQGEPLPARSPLQFQWRATLIPEERMLEGTAHWSFLEEESPLLQLGRTNLELTDLVVPPPKSRWPANTVSAVDAAPANEEKGTGQPLRWGGTPSGVVFAITSTPGTQFVAGTARLRPVLDQPDWRFQLRAPRTAINQLVLELPPGWKARSDACLVRRVANSNRVILDFSGMESVAFDVLPPLEGPGGPYLVTWESKQTYRIDVDRTTVDVELLLEAIGDRMDEVTLLLDPRLQPTDLRVQPSAAWRSQTSSEGLLRWTFSFRRPQRSLLSVRFRSVLPTDGTLGWEPIPISVVDGLPRGERIVVSLDPKLGVEHLDSGAHRLISTEVDLTDGERIRLEFKSPGGLVPPGEATHLSHEDVVDWNAFARIVGNTAAPDPLIERLRDRIPADTLEMLPRVSDAGEAAVVPDVEGNENPEPVVDEDTEAARRLAHQRFVEAMNDWLVTHDLLGPGDWRDPRLAAPVLATLERITPETPTFEVARRNRLLLDAVLPNVLRPPVRVLPWIQWSAKPRVMVLRDTFLDITESNSQLAARLTWMPKRGSLQQVTVEAPSGWNVVKVLNERTEEVLPFVVEERQHGNPRVQIRFPQPIPEDTEATLVLHFESARYVPPLREEPIAVRLPEVRVLDCTIVDWSDYTLSVDPKLSWRIPTAPSSGRRVQRPPADWPSRDSDSMTFSYLAPLPPIDLTLSARPSRFAADSSVRAVWSGVDWAMHATVEVRPEQGFSGTYVLRTSNRLPPNLSWRSTDPENPVIRFEETAASLARGEDEGPFDYRLRFAAPPVTSLTIEAKWILAGATRLLPLIELVRANPFLGRVEIESPKGIPIHVEPRGLVPVEPSAIDEGRPIVWSGMFARIAGSSRLRAVPLSAEPADWSLPSEAEDPWEPTSEWLRTPGGSPANPTARALVRTRTWYTPARSIQQIRFDLEIDQAMELVLDASLATPDRDDSGHAASAAHSLENASTNRNSGISWRIALDGKPVFFEVHPGAIEIPGRLGPGRHRLVIIAAAPRGLPGLEPGSRVCQLRHVDVIHTSWELTPDDGTIVDGLAVGEARVWERRSTPEWMTLRPTARARELEETLDRALASTAPMQKEPIAAIAHRLSNALPEGWIVLLDRWMAPSSPANVVPAASSFREFLAHRGIYAQVADQIIWLTTDPLLASTGANPTEVRQCLLATGTDPSGRFLLPAVHGEVVGTATEDVVSSKPLWDWRGSRRLESVLGQSNPHLRILDVRPWISTLLVIAISLALLGTVASREIPSVVARGLSAGLLGLAAILQLLGGWAGSLAIGPVVALALGLGLRPTRNELVPFRGMDSKAMLIGISWMLLGSDVMAEGATPLAEPIRETVPILIPFDPEDPEAPIDRVFLPERLRRQLERIEPTPRVPFLVREAHYLGQVDEEKSRVRWTASLQGEVDAGNPLPLPVSLALQGATVEAIHLDGRPIAFIPPVGAAPLELRIDRPGEVRLEIQFTSPLEIEDPRATYFRIPAAASNQIALNVHAPTGVTLTQDLVRSGWRVASAESGQATIATTLGPVDRVDLAWRANAAASLASARLVARTAHLFRLHATHQTLDLVSSIHLEITGSPTRLLELEVPTSLALRRIETEGMVGWRTVSLEPDRQMVEIELENARSGPVDLAISALPIVRSLDKFSIAIPKVRSAAWETGVIGVRLPGGWTIEPIGLRGLKEIPEAQFDQAWRSLGRTLTDPVSIAASYVRGTPDLDSAADTAETGKVAVDPAPAATPVESEATEGDSTSEEAHPAPGSSLPILLTLSARPPSPSLFARQRIQVEPHPASQQARFSVTTELHFEDGWMGLVEFPLASALLVERIESPSLIDWYRTEKGVALVLPPMARGALELVEIRLRAPLMGVDDPPWRLGMELVSLDWRSANGVETHWILRAVPGWKSQVVGAEELEVRAGVPLETDWVVSGSGPARFQLQIGPVPSESQWSSWTLITLGDTVPIAQGRLMFQFPRGHEGMLELHAPAWLGPINWQARDLRVASSTIEGNTQIWTLTSPVPLAGQIEIDWRARLDPARVSNLEVPRIQFLDTPPVSQWVAIEDRAQRLVSASSVTHLVEDHPPVGWEAWLQAMPAPLSVSRVRSLRAEDADWRLPLDRSPDLRNTPRFEVRQGTHELALGRDGRITGYSRWLLIDRRAGEIRIELPTTAEPQSLLIDGQVLRQPVREGNLLRIPLFRRGRHQAIELRWTASTGSPDIAFPSLVDATPESLHARVRLPLGYEPVDHPGAMNRAHWLQSRAQQAIIEAKLRLVDWAQSGSPERRQQAITAVAWAVAIDDQLREVDLVQAGSARATVSQGDTSRFPQTLCDELLAEFDARTLREPIEEARWTLESPLVESVLDGPIIYLDLTADPSATLQVRDPRSYVGRPLAQVNWLPIATWATLAVLILRPTILVLYSPWILALGAGLATAWLYAPGGMILGGILWGLVVLAAFSRWNAWRMDLPPIPVENWVDPDGIEPTVFRPPPASFGRSSG